MASTIVPIPMIFSKAYRSALAATVARSRTLLYVLCVYTLCLPSARAGDAFMSVFSLGPPPVDVARLPLANAIKTVQGNGRRTVYVLTDPDCRYCRELEHALAQLTNVTIYRFEYPLAGLHPNATEVARRIWCAPNRAGAWDTYEANHALPADGDTCANPIAANVALASRLGLNGTPDLINAHGQVHEGMMSLDELEHFVGGAS
jgi:hypothetical protein